MQILSKTLFAIILVSIITTAVSAQETLKLGYVNINKVLEGMDGYKSAEKKLQDFASQLQQTLSNMEQEYNSKVQEYYDQQDDMLPAIAEVKAKEISDLENRMTKLQQSSEQQLMDKQVELLTPLEDQVMKAIKDVATEKGFSYIFDASKGSNLLYYPESDDVTDLIKAKLDIQ